MKLPFRIWVLIAVLFLSLLAISPWLYFEEGVVIKSIDKNSSAFNEGLRQGMIITQINNEKVASFADYTKIVSSLFAVNETKKITLVANKQSFIFLTSSLNISVGDMPNTKIKTGLDLSGGARALIKPINVSLSSSEINDLIEITSNRLNVFGISDVSIKLVKDLQGTNYMLIEVAGATPADLKELVGKQGKFEAKIGNETAFIGGERDIASICRSDASCARIESCNQFNEGYLCRFSFAVYLSEIAAKRHADITSKLGTNLTEQGKYLDKKLDLYVDDNLVDSLFISEDLKGRVTTNIAVSGSGSGKTQQDAIKNSQENMKKLQT
ncbi:MAG: hypothetical protein AABX65_03115, partial [Nanoarchaeota archaeon]